MGCFPSQDAIVANEGLGWDPHTKHMYVIICWITHYNCSNNHNHKAGANLQQKAAGWCAPREDGNFRSPRFPVRHASPFLP